MAYRDIKPSGGDTGTDLNRKKCLTFIQRLYSIQGKKIIDCGCGTGQYVLAFLEAGGDAFGIEYQKVKVAEFKRNFPQYATRVCEGNIEQMQFTSDSFDMALLNEVLEHIPNERQALKEIYRILKPNSYLFIFSPNRLYPFETHTVGLKKSDKELSIYIPFIPYVPLKLGEAIFNYRARNYWPRQLRQLVRDSNFTIIKTDYIWQTFENISGRQSPLLSRMRSLLRRIASILERVPLIKVLGVSQVIVAQK